MKRQMRLWLAGFVMLLLLPAAGQAENMDPEVYVCKERANAAFVDCLASCPSLQEDSCRSVCHDQLAYTLGQCRNPSGTREEK